MAEEREPVAPLEATREYISPYIIRRRRRISAPEHVDYVMKGIWLGGLVVPSLDFFIQTAEQLMKTNPGVADVSQLLIATSGGMVVGGILGEIARRKEVKRNTP